MLWSHGDLQSEIPDRICGSGTSGIWQSIQTFQNRKRRLTVKGLATRTGVSLFALLFATVTLTLAQQSQTTIKKTPIRRTSPASGEEMFNAYCAVCHGKSAKGDGPAAAELKVPPADLTTLAQRHAGKFPADYVVTVLRNGVQEAKAHGSKDMPIWGPLLGSIGGGTTSRVASPEINLRIQNLTRYIESLQASASSQKIDVKIIGRRDSDSDYVYVARVYDNTATATQYQLRGATFTLQLPDGRTAVVNCESKYSWVAMEKSRSCRIPRVDKIQAEFHGDNAKLIWAVSPHGEKMKTETYKIIAILDKPTNQRRSNVGKYDDVR